MSGRALAALAAALAVGVGGTARAGELLNAYLSPGILSDPTTGVQFFNTDFTSGGPGFTTPHQARGLAVGSDSIYATISGSVGNFTLKYDLDGDLTSGLVMSSDHTPGPLAYGNDTLFLAYSSEFGGVDAVGFYNPDFTFQGGFIQVSEDITGLAYGDDSLFISYGDTLARYDLHGNLLASNSYSGFGVGFVAGPLAYGDGTLFMGYTQNIPPLAPSYGIGYLDPGTLEFNSVVEVGEVVNGLAFGDGHLFASYDFVIRRYDAAGDQTDALVTGIFGMGVQNGALAFLEDTPRVEPPCTGRLCGGGPGAVPEPASWALMIIGFGGVGAALRTRRRTGLGAAWI